MVESGRLLISELEVKGVITSSIKEINITAPGAIHSEYACSKLEFVLIALQHRGSDSEWTEAMALHDYSLIQMILQFLNISSDEALQNKAIQALLIIANIDPLIWSSYSNHSPIYLKNIISVSQNILHHLELLKSRYENKAVELKKSLTTSIYAGFDIRDILNLCSEDVAQNELLDKQKCTLQVEINAFIATIKSWLTVFQQIYSHVIPSLAKGIVNDELYTTTLYCLATLNQQLQVTDASRGFSLLVDRIASDAVSVPLRFNLAEGVLHALNDGGYPNQQLPESRAILLLVTQIVKRDSYMSGKDNVPFFRSSDIKVLVDICVRESTNISPQNHLDRCVLQRYKFLLMDIMLLQIWAETTEQYRMNEILRVLV